MANSTENERKLKLVTRPKLEAVVDNILKDAACPENISVYLKDRWIHMVTWWHTRSVKARRSYMRIRAVIVIGGVLLPLMPAVSMSEAWREYATVAIAVAGAIVAGCAAWEGVVNYGETWLGKRRAAELLKVEGWQFLTCCGTYHRHKDHAAAFPHFVAEVERMIAEEVQEYLSKFNPSNGETWATGGQTNRG